MNDGIDFSTHKIPLGFLTCHYTININTFQLYFNSTPPLINSTFGSSQFLPLVPPCKFLPLIEKYYLLAEILPASPNGDLGKWANLPSDIGITKVL